MAHKNQEKKREIFAHYNYERKYLNYCLRLIDGSQKLKKRG